MVRLGAALGAGVLFVAGLSTPAQARSIDPAYPGDFPDPYVLRTGVPGATAYYAFSTGNGGRKLQTISSPDKRTWTAPIDALAALPLWADSPGRTWAPAVVRRGDWYRMYYTVRHRGTGRQCISVASVTSLDMPFVDSSTGPLVCQFRRGGSIDPSPFVAPTGRFYLFWKSEDNVNGRPTNLWGQRLGTRGLTRVGAGPTRLLRARQEWQSGLIEGPSMFHRRGRYYLFYGGNRYMSRDAAIGYAICTRPLGGCVNQSTTRAWLRSTRRVAAPGSPEMFTEALGRPMIAYHGWTNGILGYKRGGVRALWIDQVSFSGGQPSLR